MERKKAAFGTSQACAESTTVIDAQGMLGSVSDDVRVRSPKIAARDRYQKKKKSGNVMPNLEKCYIKWSS